MKMKIAYLAAALVITTAGVIAYLQFFDHRKPTPAIKAAASTVVGQARPAFTLLDLRTKPRDIAEWDGKVVLVNFWATWCPPCVREMPALMQLREAYQGKGFEIVGVALDNKDAVAAFIDPLGIEYPILIGEQEGLQLTALYGNRLGVLPYSVIIDRKGVIRHTLISELHYADVEKLIQPLL